MTGAANWIYLGGLVAALAYLPLAGAATSPLRSLLKVLPLGLLALSAWVADGPVFLVAALIFSALGDLALSRDGRSSLLYGLSAFALAHLVYILLFLGQSQAALWDAFALSPLPAILMVALALSTEIWLAPHTGKLRWPVTAYVALIAAMMLAALTLDATLVIIGAVFFVLSDLILALRLFRGVSSRVADWLVWVFYIAGQALIVAGLLAV